MVARCAGSQIWVAHFVSTGVVTDPAVVQRIGEDMLVQS
jgi:hypothetical protein